MIKTAAEKLINKDNIAAIIGFSDSDMPLPAT
jgi:ABC-type branched-subunit amino acid transport system substrate-binding protein